jgi:hypothetical protein
VAAFDPLPPVVARLLYNVADALLPPAPGAVALDWMPAVEAVLRRRGPRARRKLLTVLGTLALRSRLLARRGFPRLSRERRARLLGGMPRADRAWLGALLAEAARAGASGGEGGHSSGA